jgi:hypothetical protein
MICREGETAGKWLDLDSIIELNRASLIFMGAPATSPSKYLAHILVAQGMPLVNLERLDRTTKPGMDTERLLNASLKRAIKKGKVKSQYVGQRIHAR